MTRRSKQYKRNRNLDVWVLAVLIALLFWGPDWLGSRETAEETPISPVTANNVEEY